ncbi:hypothetical protein C5167_012014 [Papaver somniferum]|uniref:Uncharacterized protein n=1 Tax=Papaver somniferum TaxID=3469 RepID=A0A4Y7IZE1_PAPSO|nr:uncharacterized protein LOC113355257 [Papaver somniferum]RZC53160.1 hypothetical protein C5167_012014 [Papaver somniferum]
MILSRSSSTPIMSSMLDDGRGSSRNSFTSSSSKENLQKISLPVGPSCRSCKHIRRVSSENNVKAMETAEEFDHQGDSPMKYIAVNVHARKSKSMSKPILSVSDRNNGCKNMDDLDLELEFSFPLMRHNSIDEEDHNNAGFTFFNISNGEIFPATKGREKGPTSLCMAIAPDPMIFEQNTCIDNDNGDALQQYYENILKENPYNPMILRNYAQYMYKIKGVHKKAEELYSRALLVEPNDGEILSEFARLRWEVYGEKEAASNYFARAVHASPQNSDVLAAYASFLWEAEEGEEAHDSIKHCQQLCETR